MKKFIGTFHEATLQDSVLGIYSIAVKLRSKAPFQYPLDKDGYLDVCSIGGFCFSDICFDFERYEIDTEIDDDGHLVMECYCKGLDLDYFYGAQLDNCIDENEDIREFISHEELNEEFFATCTIDEICYEAAYDEDCGHIEMDVESVFVRVLDEKGYKVVVVRNHAIKNYNTLVDKERKEREAC